MGEAEISAEGAVLLEELLEGIRALESLPLDDVAPGLGEPHSS